MLGGIFGLGCDGELTPDGGLERVAEVGGPAGSPAPADSPPRLQHGWRKR